VKSVGTKLEDDQRLAESLRLCDVQARKLLRQLPFVQLDDLVSAGREALIDVERTYDKTRGPYWPYVANKVRWAMIDSVRRETRIYQMVRRANALLAMERLSHRKHGEDTGVEDPPTENTQREAVRANLASRACALFVGLVASEQEAFQDRPDDLTDRRRAIKALEASLSSLSERERTILELHYFRGESFESIARKLDVSKSWLSRLHAQVLAKLAARIAAP
jgi:RNA polymerase sigma factor FliA